MLYCKLKNKNNKPQTEPKPFKIKMCSWYCWCGYNVDTMRQLASYYAIKISCFQHNLWKFGNHYVTLTLSVLSVSSSAYPCNLSIFPKSQVFVIMVLNTLKTSIFSWVVFKCCPICTLPTLPVWAGRAIFIEGMTSSVLGHLRWQEKARGSCL